MVVDLPLRGEWTALRTPADRIPSHGTDILGQRFAYDLIRYDRRPNEHDHPGGHLRRLLIGVPTKTCYGWGEPSTRRSMARSSRRTTGSRNAPVSIRSSNSAWRCGIAMTVKQDDAGLIALAGNHVVLRASDAMARDAHAVLAHMSTGSIATSPGQRVVAGDVLGRVGHTGNSTAPHLHFQLMDGPDARTARAIPCAFRAYEALRGGTWVRMEASIPTGRERIRSIPARAASPS